MNRIYLQLFAEEGEPDNGGSEQNQAGQGKYPACSRELLT